MKATKNILPLLFFFLVVVSFSVNALISITTPSEHISRFEKKISSPTTSKAQENFVFEELEEDDSEDLGASAFLLLPFYNLTCSISQTKALHFNFRTFQKAIQPIFISIRVLRI